MPIKLENQYNENYTGGGEYALVDGVTGSLHFRDGRWQGFLGKDVSAVVDLGEKTNVRKISIGFLQRSVSSIFFPSSVEFSISSDGSDFEKLNLIENDVPARLGEMMRKEFAVELKGKQARFVKILAKNIARCPEWHQNAGGKAWLFADEITIE